MRLGIIEPQQKRKIQKITVHNRCMIDARLITLRVFARCGTIGATAELTGYSPPPSPRSCGSSSACSECSC